LDAECTHRLTFAQNLAKNICYKEVLFEIQLILRKIIQIVSVTFLVGVFSLTIKAKDNSIWLKINSKASFCIKEHSSVNANTNLYLGNDIKGKGIYNLNSKNISFIYGNSNSINRLKIKSNGKVHMLSSLNILTELTIDNTSLFLNNSRLIISPTAKIDFATIIHIKENGRGKLDIEQTDPFIAFSFPDKISNILPDNLFAKNIEVIIQPFTISKDFEIDFLFPYIPFHCDEVDTPPPNNID
jgi:hypothetical protein